MKRHRLLVAVFASMALAGWSQDIIIESFADGQNSQAFSSVEGKWTESTAKSTAPGLTATKALFNDANTDPAVARFTPQIPAAGQYEVFITYPTSGNASDIKYTVVSADGTKEFSITQNGRDFGHSPQANQWHSIGTFNFSEGNSGYIEVSDPLTGEKPLANEPNARIYVDAIKLVPKSGSAPAATGAVVNAETEAATAAVELASAATTPAASTPAASTPAAGATAALPSLPATTTTPASGDMPGLTAVQPSPTPAAAIPALPDTTAQTGAAAQLPGLPAATPATDPVATLPALPGTTTPTPAATEMPALPESTPGAAVAMPALPSEPTATPGLPALPSDSASVTVTETQTVTAQATPYPVPNLPSLAPVTPTPERTLPSVADTPVPGVATGLPGGALSALTPAVPTPGFPSTTGIPSTPASLMPPAGLSTPGAMTSVPGMPGAVPMAPTPPPPGTSISEYNPANLQWMYDFGAALNTARAQNKKVLVFFTAEGNKAAHTYETQYFTHPTVRQALNNYVLVKVDFPKNTRLGYSLGIFGAGIIVVADQTGDVTNRIEQLPSTPVDLLQQMANVKTTRPTPAAGAGGTTGTADTAAGTTTPQ